MNGEENSFMTNIFGTTFHDFAGSTVVHSVGGWIALVGAAVLGPRIGKYGKDGRSKAIPGHSLTLACLGVFILWFGWFGFNPGSQLAAATGTDQTVISHVFLTTNLAACAGGFFALTASWIKYGKPSLSLTLNGVLAGLVGVTAGCDLVSPFGAVMIGAICGIVMIFSVDFIDHILKIDDPVGASSVHGVCGCLGTILTGLFATEEGLLYGGGYNFLLAQLFGTTVVGCWAAGMGYLIFKGLDKNRSEVRHMLLTEFDEKKFAKSMWKEGHESGYTEGRESILEILDAINRGNDTVEKLTALGYDAKTAQEVLEKK